jgi:hypothetical protein
VTDRLGPQVRVHGPDYIGFGCVATLGLIAAGLFFTCGGSTIVGLASPGVHSLLGVGLTVAPGVLVYWAFTRLAGGIGMTWAVHERGLRITTRGRVDDVPWDDIREVVIRARLDKQPVSYTLYSVATADRMWRFYNLETDDADELAASVATSTHQRLAADVLARLDRGEWVELGEIALSRSGVRWSGELVPWADVVEFERESMSLRPLLKDGRRLGSLFLDDVPNGHVLPDLLDLLRVRDRVIET